MISAVDSLARLRDGNARFVAGRPVAAAAALTRTALVDGQEPFAIILGCSDSRVPVEMVFDQGFGDLFVIRVAGNIVAPSLLGSIEFAASRFGTRLVVVVGHTRCGAVTAALEELQGHPSAESRNLRSIVDRVRPSIEPLMRGAAPADDERLMHAAVRANVSASVEQVRRGSALLQQLIRDDGLLVAGAEYSLETGVVDFFDGVPGGAEFLA
ncbi:MAG: carbonic anhydrase [Gemmatimonadales bacterium]